MSDAESSRPEERPNPVLFARARVALGAAATRAVREALAAIADDLDHAADGVRDARERQALGMAAAQLRREAIGRSARVADVLSQRAMRCLELARAKGTEDTELELLDDEALEAQILAVALAAAIRDLSGPRYERYANRMRRIVSGHWSDDDRNPLGARSLASAAVAAVTGIADPTAVRGPLRTAIRQRLAAPLAAAIGSVDTMLESADVPAEAYEAVGQELQRQDRSDSSDEQKARDEQAKALQSTPRQLADVGARAEAFLADVPVARKSADGAAPAALDVGATTLAASPLGGHRDRPSGAKLSALAPLADVERDAVALAHAEGATPYSREARRAFFDRARSGLAEANASTAQVAVLDLVSAMFEYVIDERRMPEPAKPLVWRLQQPAIALALLDPAYLGDEPRSLRRLIEHIGAIAVAFAEDLSYGSELYRRIEAVVGAVEAVSGALQMRSTVIARQVEREYSRAAEHVEQLIRNVAQERHSLEAAPNRRNRRDYSRRPSAERERAVGERVRELIEQRLGHAEIPDSVRDFLFNVWLRHLRTAALRNGEDSTEFRVAMEVVDDLVWSLDGVGGGDRRELAERIPPLIRLMTQGVREIGARDDEFRAFFDELFLIHLRRMQRRNREQRREGRGESSVRPQSPQSPVTAEPAVPGPSVAPGGSRQPRAGSSSVTSAASPAASPDHPPLPAGQAARPPASDARPPASGTDPRVLEVLESLDLDDLAEPPRRLRLAPLEAWSRLSRGKWLELVGPDERSTVLKVAWINQRRSVALLVRRPDRRAVSMRMDDLKSRFERGRAHLLEGRR